MNYINSDEIANPATRLRLMFKQLVNDMNEVHAEARKLCSDADRQADDALRQQELDASVGALESLITNCRD